MVYHGTFFFVFRNFETKKSYLDTIHFCNECENTIKREKEKSVINDLLYGNGVIFVEIKFMLIR